MINTDPVPQMPATWPALPVAEAVLEHLRTLWRISTTDDQRHTLEVLAADIVELHAPPRPNGFVEAPYGMEDAADDMRLAISELQRLVDTMGVKS